MRDATENASQKKEKKQKGVFSEEEVWNNTAYILIVRQMQIIYTEWITAGRAVCVQIILQILEKKITKKPSHLCKE